MGNGKEIELKINEKELQEILWVLALIPKEIGPLLYRAIDKTTRGSRTDIVNRIASEVFVKKKDIRDSIRYQKPSYTRWQARLKIDGRRLPLLHFGARQTMKGVSYKIDRNGGREMIPHAFIEEMKSGHRGVFKRTGLDDNLSPRLPITEKKGPSMGHLFSRAGNIANEVTESTADRLLRNIDAQLIRILEKKKAGRGLKRLRTS